MDDIDTEYIIWVDGTDKEIHKRPVPYITAKYEIIKFIQSLKPNELDRVGLAWTDNTGDVLLSVYSPEEDVDDWYLSNINERDTRSIIDLLGDVKNVQCYRP
jgi:hypothetical protein